MKQSLKTIITIVCTWLAAVAAGQAQTVLGKTLGGDSLIVMMPDKSLSLIPFQPADSLSQPHNVSAVDEPQKRILLGLAKRPKGYKAPQRIDREISKNVFIPKGTWMVGGAASYQEYNAENLNYLIIKDGDGLGYTLGVSPFAGYFFSNNNCAGLRLAYDRTYVDLGNVDINLGEDFNISMKDVYLLEHTWEAAAFMRNYMPMGKSKVFALFNEVRLTYADTTGKNSTGKGNTLDGTYEREHKVQLGISPGVLAFVTNNIAMEIQVNVMGLNYKWSRQSTNQVEEGKMHSAGANFKINLFSIAFGTSLYF